ncbi:MAG: peptidylprolyl isomerase [Bacteroidota bacterium]
MIKPPIFLALFVLLTASLTAQQDGDVLFSVAGEPVTVGEFRYIYTKTNGEQADFSKESVREYLDLYQRFKLKVARARAMGLDTITALQKELEGYRRQLADNYLVDRQVTDKLVAALHARQQEDVEISHILLKFKGNPLADDTLSLYNKVSALKAEVTTANFAEQARTHSEDQYSKERGGKIGFITAPFPKGLHRLEAAVYAAPANSVVGPIRSSLGYHLAIKHTSRPARGEVEVAHVMVRKPEGTAKGSMPVPAKLTSAQRLLEQGQDFAKVAATYSEDEKTAQNAGYIGFFGINRYEPAFEDAAFALQEDGAVSDIVETSVGFHLLRRISRKGVQPLNDVRPLLETKVKADGRFEDAKKAMLQNIRSEANVKEDPAVLGRFAATLQDTSFFNFRWQPRAEVEQAPLLTIGDDYQVGLATFQDYLRQNARKRLALGRRPRTTAATVVNTMYEEWVEGQLMSYAESRLEEDFPEFAALMREYREGILLFEATKIEVWDKASEDTTGLEAFYAAHADDYQWDERATVAHYVLNTKSGLDEEEVREFAKANGLDATLDKFGRANLDGRLDDYELPRLSELGDLTAKPGAVTQVTKDLRKGTASFYVIQEILPARRKELKEARGYVIADYQDQLEREWVDQLREQFPVKINKKVLAKLIKS